MTEAVVTGMEQECRDTIEHFRRELAKLRSGRASTGLLENLTVEYYGAAVPLQQLGLINAPEPRLLTIQVYDSSAVDTIEKAIRSADLGLNPARDGSLIRVPIPALTEERRKELVKNLHRLAEENRVSVRNHRRDAVELLRDAQKNKEISEDDLHRWQERIQKVTDQSTADLDKLLAAKEKEVMEG